jgi:hypothetical protein
MSDAAAPLAKPSTPAIPENFSYSDHPHFAPPRASLPPDHPIHLDTETEGESEHDVWIFGYGSLLFKVDFEYVEKRSGWVRGWRRVWWQGSIDHRGIESYWGRVWVLSGLGPHFLGSISHVCLKPTGSHSSLKPTAHSSPPAHQHSSTPSPHAGEQHTVSLETESVETRSSTGSISGKRTDTAASPWTCLRTNQRLPAEKRRWFRVH